jgi:hypothetical protein
MNKFVDYCVFRSVFEVGVSELVHEWRGDVFHEQPFGLERSAILCPIETRYIAAERLLFRSKVGREILVVDFGFVQAWNVEVFGVCEDVLHIFHEDDVRHDFCFGPRYYALRGFEFWFRFKLILFFYEELADISFEFHIGHALDGAVLFLREHGTEFFVYFVPVMRGETIEVERIKEVLGEQILNYGCGECFTVGFDGSGRVVTSVD